MIMYLIHLFRSDKGKESCPDVRGVGNDFLQEIYPSVDQDFMDENNFMCFEKDRTIPDIPEPSKKISRIWQNWWICYPGI